MPDELREAFRASSPKALAALNAILSGEDESAKAGDRIRASEVILDRAWGKPVQAIEADIQDSRPTVDTSKLTPEQKAVLATLAISQMEGTDV